jgi:RimJ/RimL family protein N-acetyltransferase
MDPQALRERLALAPRELRAGRVLLSAPSLDQIPVRMAWAAAAHDALEFVPRWRKSIDRAVATASAERELACFDRGEEQVYNVFEIATGAYVGRLDLHSWDADAPRCEVGYMADPRTARRGLLREAALACLDLAFELGAVRVQAITDARNLRSIHFAKSLGMQEEGILRNYERLSGVLCDQVLLSVLQS